MAKIKWKGDKLKAGLVKHAEKALFEGCSHILNEANNIAPLDDGTLTQTAGVDIDNNDMMGSVFYVQKYAPRLHENPQYNFQRGRQGKWLEKTIYANMKAVEQYMAKEIQRAFGGGL